MRKTVGASGFTLIELLVALTLLALFATLLAGTLRFGISANDRVAAHADWTDRLLRARSFLRERLGNARPIWTGDVVAQHIDFGGDATQVQFDADTPQSEGGIGIATYKLTFDHTDQGGRITCTVTPPTAEGASPTRYSTVLIDRLPNLTIAYYGRPLSGGAPIWQSDWHEREQLPALVSISAQGAPPEPERWPVLTIHPQLNADARCSLDTETLHCRVP